VIWQKDWYDEFRTWEGLRNDVYSTRNHGRIVRKLNSRRIGWKGMVEAAGGFSRLLKVTQ